MYDEKRQEMDDMINKGCKQVLLNSDVIGMTTNGAAKFQDLIRSVNPKIIICEEAGEVLEAHILGALTPSIQHLILIGDHNQLRPHIATYSLSMDSLTGKIYQLDKSLFERLVNGDNAVKIEKSQLLTQKRMRKEVSDLIRYTLYPNLVDGDNTAKYENVRGAQHNVYFIDHRHPEDGSCDDFVIQSHANMYEVKMVVEMVKYFVSNGYTKSDDIAVLTPYLGQMMKIREALAKSFVVVVDERDEQNIIELEEEREGEENDNRNNNNNINSNIFDKSVGAASIKSLNQQVTLRTVDNFQGEEATIIIVSLVRNFSGAGGHDTIGFLKSTNRSNVLLSRAREGMYLIGNSELMALRSKDMWEPVIKMLRERDPPQVGFGMPIVCNRHPNYKHIITEPEQFEQVSPDGGCKEQCDMLLPCGHTCTQKCHSDDLKHVGVQCRKHCTRLQSECNHPCPKLCYEDCGRCEFSIGDIILPCDHEFKDVKCWQEKNKEKIHCKHPIDITLPCGHVLNNAECWQEKDKEKIHCKHPIDITLPCGHVLNNAECWQIQEEPTCMELVTIKLPCKHCKVMNCTASVDNAECKEKCGRQLACGHECLSECHECQKLYVPQESGEFDTNVPIKRTLHGNCRALCNKPLFCGHLCKQNCHKGYECSPCKNRCSISCEHTRCNGHCLEPCALCAEKCSWECKHQGRCELSCGIPCSRLPCNERCDKVLICGHKCAGVCGEICPSISYCVDCASETVKNQVSDTITDTIFSEIDWDQERMIILSCGHVFTMKSMDTLMEMKNYYKGSIDGGWTSAKMLPTSSTDIKTCPECNSPIRDIRRYGRITKKYTLDAQNRKFLLKYYYQLDEIRKQVNSFVFGGKLRKNRIQLKEDLIEILESESISRGEVTFKECKNMELPEIIPYYYFENIGIYHGFDENSEQIWIVHVKKLLKRYNELTFIVRATKFPPHKKALEASISNLNVNPENQLISRGSSNSNSTPSEYLQLTSQVDHKIYLDAVFEIINIQKILHSEIIFIIRTFESEFNIKEVLWITFAQRLQQTIQQHLYAIRKAAESANYGRYFLLVNVETLELDLKMIAYQLRYQYNEILDDNATQTRIKKNCEGIKERTIEANKNCRASNDNEIDESEFKSDIYKRLKNLLKNCDKVIACVENSSTNIDDLLETEELPEMENLEIDQVTKLKFNRSDMLNTEVNNSIFWSDALETRLCELYMKDDVVDIFWGRPVEENLAGSTSWHIYVITLGSHNSYAKTETITGNQVINFIAEEERFVGFDDPLPSSLKIPQGLKEKFNEVLDNELGLSFREAHYNLVGVGTGYKQIRGQFTETPAIIFYVRQKGILRRGCNGLLPKEIRGFPTDVIEACVAIPCVGIGIDTCRRHQKNVTLGSSIGIGSEEAQNTTGTLSAIAYKNSLPNQIGIISCEHVLKFNESNPREKITIYQPSYNDHFEPKRKLIELIELSKELDDEYTDEIMELTKKSKLAESRDSTLATYVEGIRKNFYSEIHKKEFGVDAGFCVFDNENRKLYSKKFPIRSNYFESAGLSTCLEGTYTYCELKNFNYNKNRVFKVGRTTGLTLGQLLPTDQAIACNLTNESIKNAKKLEMEKHIPCYNNADQKIFIGYMKSKLDSEIRQYRKKCYPIEWFDRQLAFKFESGDFDCGDSGASVIDETGKALGILHAKWITPYQTFGIASPYFAILEALDVSICLSPDPVTPTITSPSIISPLQSYLSSPYSGDQKE